VQRGDSADQRRWGAIARGAAWSTLQVSPLILLLCLIPMIADGAMSMRALRDACVLTILMLPVMFAVMTIVQILPKRWSG
jgi:hypothetical protein